MEVGIKTKVVILLIFFLLFSCHKELKQGRRYSEKQTKSLHLEDTQKMPVSVDSIVEIDLSSFFETKVLRLKGLVKSLHVVALESVDLESLISDIEKIIVSDSYIYIMDRVQRRGCAIFDRTGKFIKRLSHGRGPGELSKLYDIAYDKQHKQLIAYEGGSLLFFNETGEFIKSKKMPMWFHEFKTLPDGYILKTFGKGDKRFGELSNCHLFVVDSDFRIEKAGITRKALGRVLRGKKYLYPTSNDIIRITEDYNDTIYTYDVKRKQIRASFFLNFLDKKIPEEFLYNCDFSKYRNELRNNNYYYYLGEYLETKDHNVFFIKNSRKGVKTVIYRDKKTGNVIGGSGIPVEEEGELPFLAFPSACTEEYLISIYFPIKKDQIHYSDSLISEEDRKKLERFKEEDNPFLIFFELGSF